MGVQTTFRITRVESKRPDRVNRWHDRVTGKVCTVETLDWGGMAYFQIWGVVGYDYADIPMRYRTSPVLKTKEQDGVLTIETENSVYTLEMLNE